MSDEELLDQYVRHGSQTAFTALVERHLNLVYSVARRHLHSTDLAKDVAQSVFIDLARGAARIKRGTPIIAWLHVVSRRTAIDAARGETRRHAYEQEAAEPAPMRTPAEDWRGIERMLDEAVESLSPTDRTAVLLRFFENRSLREVGLALDASEDAAQKRVSRALEQLRDYFSRRGISVTAAALATDLSAHVVHVAPAGLSTTIATASFPVGVAVHVTTQLIGIGGLQKAVMTLMIAAASGAGIYESVVFARQASEFDALAKRSAQAQNEIHAARQAQSDAANRLKGIEDLIDAQLRRRPADAAAEATIRQWLGHVAEMKAFLSQHPELNIPELELLPQSAWINVVSGQLPGETPPQFANTEEYLRRATSNLRHKAQNALAAKMRSALAGYMRAHANAFPDHPRQLAPYFIPAITPAILERYEVVERTVGQTTSRVISDRRPADLDLDAYWWVGTNGFGNAGSAIGEAVNEAQRAFAKANGGRRATNPEDIRPFLRWTVSDESLRKHLPAPR